MWADSKEPKTRQPEAPKANSFDADITKKNIGLDI